MDFLKKLLGPKLLLVVAALGVVKLLGIGRTLLVLLGGVAGFLLGRSRIETEMAEMAYETDWV